MVRCLDKPLAPSQAAVFPGRFHFFHIRPISVLAADCRGIRLVGQSVRGRCERPVRTGRPRHILSATAPSASPSCPERAAPPEGARSVAAARLGRGGFKAPVTPYDGPGL